MEFLRENAVIIAPVAVAIVSGIFYLIKKGGNNNRQNIKNVSNSTVNQSNGSNNESRDRK